MFKTRVTQSFLAISFSLGFINICNAQAIAELEIPNNKPVTEKPLNKVPTQAESVAQLVKISQEDLSHLKHPIKPILWKVEGNGMKKDSYLFGSIHVADQNICELHPIADKAFQQADTVATEVSLGIINQVRIVKKMMRDDDTTLEESIGDELYKKLDDQLKSITPVYSASMFNGFKTWAVFLSFGFLEEQLKGGEALDAALQKRASKAGKNVWYLESLNQHLGGFSKLTEKEQISLLKDALYFQSLQQKHQFTTLQILKNLYLKGNEEQILPSLDVFNQFDNVDIATNEKFMNLLLNERNVIMADKIAKTFSQKPAESHFIIAGALHYLGDGNVIELLRKEGYIVTRQK